MNVNALSQDLHKSLISSYSVLQPKRAAYPIISIYWKVKGKYYETLYCWKPSLAKAIFEGLGGNPATEKKNGCYEHGTDVVTWCFGHMLRALWSSRLWREIRRPAFWWPADQNAPPPEVQNSEPMHSSSKLNHLSSSRKRPSFMLETRTMKAACYWWNLITQKYKTCSAPSLQIQPRSLSEGYKALANMQPNEKRRAWQIALWHAFYAIGIRYNLTRGYCKPSGQEKGFHGVLNVGRG